MSAELKPCPFCTPPNGAKATVYHNTQSDCERDWSYHVECDCCGASGPSDTDKAQAILEWNTRAPAQGALTDAPGGEQIFIFRKSELRELVRAAEEIARGQVSDAADAARLLHISKNGINHHAYSAHVLRRGGDGDLMDIRSYLDAVIDAVKRGAK